MSAPFYVQCTTKILAYEKAFSMEGLVQSHRFSLQAAEAFDRTTVRLLLRQIPARASAWF